MKVWSLYKDIIVSSLRKKQIQYTCFFIGDGEDYKNQKTINYVYSQLLNFKCYKQSPVIALGGGIVGDLSGYIATTYMRGIPFIYIPTTLLAMIDASIGAKVAINLFYAKNIIGGFKRPTGILCDAFLLRTLSKKEIANGMSEVIKHAIIGDKRLLLDLENDCLDYNVLIRRASLVKLKIIKKDFYDICERSFLNFGHSFAHAIEVITNYKISHGYAVSVGMVEAIKKSIEEQICCDFNLLHRVIKVLKKYNLPIKCSIEKKRILLQMRYDKKLCKKKIMYILICKIGVPIRFFEIFLINKRK